METSPLLRRVERERAARREAERLLEAKSQELWEANEELRSLADTLESQLVRAQKLESVGQIAAGIAHEINTPIQYVGDNTRFLQDAFGDLTVLLGRLESLSGAAAQSDVGVDPEVITAALGDADVAYLVEEIPSALTQSLEGLARVAKIVAAMRAFSHPGGEKVPSDLNAAIESTVTVATAQWKSVAEVDLDLDPLLPPVAVDVSEFNQVILNMVVNAAHAIGDVVAGKPGTLGTITISSRRFEGVGVEVRISDTGAGIPEDVRDLIFDPFFTTKGVGKGTGQGLSIAHSVIVRNHGGGLLVESDPGQGTTFIIRLPVEQPDLDGSEDGALQSVQRIA